MAKLILKSPYLKCGGKEKVSGYLRYIATRERVQRIADDRPATQKQEQLITKLLRDFPDAKELLEYETYLHGAGVQLVGGQPLRRLHEVYCHSPPF